MTQSSELAWLEVIPAHSQGYLIIKAGNRMTRGRRYATKRRREILSMLSAQPNLTLECSDHCSHNINDASSQNVPQATNSDESKEVQAKIKVHPMNVHTTPRNQLKKKAPRQAKAWSALGKNDTVDFSALKH